jgi:dienelactone hydrolase
MTRLAVLCTVLLIISVQAIEAQTATQSPARSQDLQTGVVLPKVVCAAQPEQSYALYLPSKYTREKQWPIVYTFDPGARGTMPVELMKDAAERYGYIVVGSNNSQNGPWKLEAEAARAMAQDAQARLAIDNKRAYLAGLSGGARFASALAQRCDCAAGVLMSGAGFAPGSPPAPGGTFAVFGAVGSFDFNYGELVELDAKLETLHYTHVLRRFDGIHEWAPASVMNEGLAWFRLIEMKTGRAARDEAFVKEQAAEAETRAKNVEASGDPYCAWQEYRQAAETFHGLGEFSAFGEHAAALEKEKAVRDGAKREQQDFEEQTRLMTDISSGMSALRQDSAGGLDQRNEVAQQISELRSRAEHEKNPQKLRVLRRALSGVFIEAMEAGDDRCEAKDFARARIFYELGVNAETDSAWAWRAVAEVRAMTGDRKGAFEAIRHVKEKSKDPAAFSKWLEEEPAFAKLRDTPEFPTLLPTTPEPR